MRNQTLFLILLFAGSLSSARPQTKADVGSALLAVSRCTAEQGQRLIDEGRYEHAIREFTCVIDVTFFESVITGELVVMRD